MPNRILLYWALGLLLYSIDMSIYNIEFWCIVGLFWATDKAGRNAGFAQATLLHKEVVAKAHQIMNEAKKLEFNNKNHESK